MNQTDRETLRRLESEYCASTDRLVDLMEATKKANAAGVTVARELAAEATKALEDNNRAAAALVNARREIMGRCLVEVQ